MIVTDMLRRGSEEQRNAGKRKTRVFNNPKGTQGTQSKQEQMSSTAYGDRHQTEIKGQITLLIHNSTR